MRLRKNMKRTAAAVLALSMAVSAVAAPASAAYICDVSKGDVVVSVDKSGTQTITVGGENVQDDGKGDGIIIIGRQHQHQAHRKPERRGREHFRGRKVRRKHLRG